MPNYTEEQAARAIIDVLDGTDWEPLALAHGLLAVKAAKSAGEVANVIYDKGDVSKKQAAILASEVAEKGLIPLLQLRTRMGSAENPITKLFPAAVTERRFIDFLDDLKEARPGIDYEDDRAVRHSLTDFTITEGKLRLPINIKNAGTQFESAKKLVGLDPQDCIPIPAYKAFGAIERLPHLLYSICVDYKLIGQLTQLLPQLFSENEAITWEILNKYSGARVKKAEDKFVSTVTKNHWERIAAIVSNNPFHVISAKRSVRILRDKPERTPGVGLKAWGTSASGEVNVHISIAQETTPWETVRDRIIKNGLIDVLQAIDRKITKEVDDPEI